MRKILHIGTGGTIGGCVPEYSELERLTRIFPDTPDIHKYLTESFQMHAEYSEIFICKKDSREITHDDRVAIVETITNAVENGIKHVFITHGTYTMPETGMFLLEHLAPEVLSQVSVIITGSMYPLNVIGSDALLNLGSTIGQLLNTSSSLGVKINMHGKNWDPTKVKKNVGNLLFEEI